MKKIFNVKQSIGGLYPKETGRLKLVGEENGTPLHKVALVGDSTIDNGFWVQQEKPYAHKTATVTHQAAVALASSDSTQNYLVANFAVDGSTTSDLQKSCSMRKVLPPDDDHPMVLVTQLREVEYWHPDVVVLSVAGNNYREALQSTLIGEVGYKNLILRSTPEESKEQIAEEFNRVKEKLLREYKQIIDDLIDNNQDLSRLVILSQYFPELTQFTPYMIYTGFSHVARAEGQTNSAFEAMENTMNELYKELIDYASKKEKQIVFVDVTSSMNPLAGNHTMQIEPNHRGAKVMGRLISEAVTLEDTEKNWIISEENGQIKLQPITEHFSRDYSVRSLGQFIQSSRYKHIGLFFSSSSNLATRFESAYHMLVGKQFDAQYTGMFALGLLDASLITILAQYLLRVALNDDNSKALKVAAAVVATPILVIEHIVALASLLVLSLPILSYHHMAKLFLTEEPEPEFLSGLKS